MNARELIDAVRVENPLDGSSVRVLIADGTICEVVGVETEDHNGNPVLWLRAEYSGA